MEFFHPDIRRRARGVLAGTPLSEKRPTKPSLPQ